MGQSAQVVVIANQKGGVAKTTTAVNVAAVLAGKLGKRVLLMDLDPQAGCALQMGIDTTDLPKSLYDVLVEPATDLRSVCTDTEFGFSFAPSNIDLAAAELQLNGIMAREFVLQRKLQPVLADYDLIIIDTPPTLGLLTLNALSAARLVLVPLACQYMALRGLDMLLGTLDQVRASLNPDLELWGILPTFYDNRTVHSREVYAYLVKLCREQNLPLVNTYVKASVRFHEAPNQRTPLVLLHPELDGAKAYVQVAEELARA